jgi:transposase
MTLRRKYTKEQKLQIVKQSLEEGVTLSSLSEQYDIHPNIISRWRGAFLKDGEVSFPGNGNQLLTDIEKENLRLKKELKEAELERDILKKAIHIFSRNDGKFTNS